MNDLLSFFGGMAMHDQSNDHQSYGYLQDRLGMQQQYQLGQLGSQVYRQVQLIENTEKGDITLCSKYLWTKV